MTCTQFGFFQSTSGSRMFSNLHSIHTDYQQCYDVFGLTPNQVDIGIRKTLQRYGYPEDYNGTNVVLTNGEYDPWAPLGSYVNNPETHTTSVVTPKASHCSDLYEIFEGEPKGLNRTREIVAKEIEYFLTL